MSDYSDLASIRANTQASVAFQALQSGLLMDMSHSMHAVHDQMAAVRQQQGEALAIQQEMLQKEQLQSHLEEFLYQADKLIVECSDMTTDIPPSSRYFVLMEVLNKIKNDGIATSIIKGRENKASFEKVVKQTKELTQLLLKDPEVQEAIEWANAERKRLEDEQKETSRKNRDLVLKMQQKIELLKSEMGIIKIVTPMDVFHEYRAKANSFLDSNIPIPWLKTIVLIVGWIFAVYPGFLVIIPCILIATSKRNSDNKKDLIAEIATLDQKILKLSNQ
jgi:hypothetical protein